MITLPQGVETIHWLIDLEWSSAGTVQHYLWTDAPTNIPVQGTGTFDNDNPLIGMSNLSQSGVRLEARRWQLILADPERLFRDSRYAAEWRRRRCRLYLHTQPGNGVTLWKTGFLVSRQFPVQNDVAAAVLTFGGLLDRNFATKKRYMNKDSQRAVDSDDDSLDLAQRKIDLNWGGN